MRFSILAVATLVTVEAFAPHPVPKSVSSTQLEMKNNKWLGPVAVSIASLTLAGQIASATMPSTFAKYYEETPYPLDVPTTVTAAIDTMDFSMPSYDEASKGDVKNKGGAPAFNPFGDFTPSIVDNGADSADKEAAAAKKAEEKEAAAAKKAEAAAKKAEEKAAKEAAKEARRLEQAELQRAAQERAQQADEGSSAKFVAPDLSDIKAPDLKMPDISSFKAPDIKMPDMSSFKAPEMPDISSFKAPEMPDVKVPDFAGKLNIPDLPENFPKIDASSLPKFDTSNLPKVSIPGFDSQPIDLDSLEPQEVRDQRAREARETYLEADEEAKAAEQVARQVRGTANEKLKLAREAKDLACETRPGGKLICLRNPFTVGY
ncbi:hypothetical protein FisN_13Hh254 [Fistulifera solaris]|uniref:Uncharacterized protein n=1 Tax=Fistulifera solaris TaxID=1519565 RepID=A0A1Z5KMV3_FISSO|nr:hypothetical protein FisN_13Hh254 [Fistulifera solaris]|eukprot:GAX27654.1 hypothetical protein FisN_13Hh254 [Fistulifera solaris]